MCVHVSDISWLDCKYTYWTLGTLLQSLMHTNYIDKTGKSLDGVQKAIF